MDKLYDSLLYDLPAIFRCASSHWRHSRSFKPTVMATPLTDLTSGSSEKNDTGVFKYNCCYGDLILMDSETAAETRLFHNLADGIGMKTLS